MGIIRIQREWVKTFSETDVDVTATELLGLREFVVESYEIDEARQESRFHCRIHLEYAICSRCRSVSDDIHQYKSRRIRDMMCFGRVVYLYHFHLITVHKVLSYRHYEDT